MTAQVCRSGHAISDSADRSPELREAFCSKCGSPTLMACEACGAPIRGDYRSENVLAIVSNYRAPNFCYQCGEAYPWTAERLRAAGQLADELDGLKPQEREALKLCLPDLLSDRPGTEAAIMRVKKVFRKLGSEAAEALRRVLVDVATESVRKTLGM